MSDFAAVSGQRRPHRNHGLLPVLVSIALLWAMVPLLHRPTPTSPLISTSRAPDRHPPDLGSLPLGFESNAGQADPEVRFTAHVGRAALGLTADGAVWTIAEPRAGGAAGDHDLAPAERQPSSGAVRLQFLNSNPSVETTLDQPLPGKVSYFQGNDPSRWRTGLTTYRRAHYSNLYPGVDLSYEGTHQSLKGTYSVAPEADPAAIRWRYDAASRVEVDRSGNLNVTLAVKGRGPLGADTVVATEDAPVAWQSIDGARTSVTARYDIAANGIVGFTLGHYDHRRPLVIDPLVPAPRYSTYLGGDGKNPQQPMYGGFPPPLQQLDNTMVAGNSPQCTISSCDVVADFGGGVAADPEGAVYVVGASGSTNFPTRNPYMASSRNANTSAFVAKFAADGSNLEYATYLSGTTTEYGLGIAVDGSRSAYVAGVTDSADFPTTKSAFQPTKSHSLGGAGFVTKLSPDGSQLVYSTYLASLPDRAYDSVTPTGIALDTAGSAYVAGSTGRPYPLKNPIPGQDRYTGGADIVFVTKLDPSGSSLAYSTYLGVNDLNDSSQATGIGVDGHGSAYVSGHAGRQFPTKNGVFNQYTKGANGGADGFLSVLAPSGSALLYSTYLGGPTNHANDDATGVAVDGTGRAYVTGTTEDEAFPIKRGLTSPVKKCADGPRSCPSSAFVAVLDTTQQGGASLVYSTYLGGSDRDVATGIALDLARNAWVTGYTLSYNFPVTPGAFQPTRSSSPPPGRTSAFVSQVDPAQGGALALRFSTYLGGNGINAGLAIAASGGDVAVTGLTTSTDFLTAGCTVYQPHNAAAGQRSNAFVTVLRDGAGVSGLEPHGGPTSGGTQVSVCGVGLALATGVRFGDTIVAKRCVVPVGTDADPCYSVESDYRLTVVAPAHGPGPVDVRVLGPFGDTPPNPPNDVFTFEGAGACTVNCTPCTVNCAPCTVNCAPCTVNCAPCTIGCSSELPGAPVVTGVSPACAVVGVPTSVIVTGTGFSGSGVAVTFDGVVAPDAVTNSQGTEITVAIPLRGAGSALVSVSSARGRSLPATLVYAVSCTSSGSDPYLLRNQTALSSDPSQSTVSHGPSLVSGGAFTSPTSTFHAPPPAGGAPAGAPASVAASAAAPAPAPGPGPVSAPLPQSGITLNPGLGPSQPKDEGEVAVEHVHAMVRRSDATPALAAVAAGGACMVVVTGLLIGTRRRAPRPRPAVARAW